MKKALPFVICVVALVVIGGLMHRTKTPPNAASQTASKIQLPSDVNDVIAAWRAGAVVPLTSGEAELEKAVSQFQDASLETVSTSFPPTKSVDLTVEQSSDLANAIIGFLFAYHSNDPSKVFSYMQQQGKRLDSESRKALTRGVSKKSKRDVSQLSDEEFYVEAWNQFKIHSHWYGLVAEESTWQTWDGNGMSVEEIRQIETDPLSNPLSTAAVLSRLFRGDSTSRHNFIPAIGSLEQELTTTEPVILVDMTLIIQLDQSLANERVAYITRFWFNRTAGKWQPISFIGIPWSPTINAMPSILH